jgi:maltose alpha-D-glucosyltransferase/alpha-amylase
MRKEVPEIGWGQFEIIKTGDDSVLGLRYDWEDGGVMSSQETDHVSPTEVTPEWAKGLWTLGGLSRRPA